MTKVLLLLPLLLCACGTYSTQKNGEFATVTVDGVHDPLFVYMEAKKACPNGLELLSEGKDKSGKSFFKYRCL